MRPGPVSPSEQPDRPGFRANFSRWGPGGPDLKPHPIRAVLKLPKTHPIRVSSGFDYLRTDQMFGPMPLLEGSESMFLLQEQYWQTSGPKFGPTRYPAYRSIHWARFGLR